MEVPWVNNWVQWELFDLIGEALEAADVTNRFIPLPIGGQDIDFAFISPATDRKAVEAGLIPAGGINELDPRLQVRLKKMRGLD
jgi:hypothetical protein